MLFHRRQPRRWSNVAGSYSPNAFAIRLPPDTAVIDPTSLQVVQDDPEALAVLAHEYWHYLQNLTTVAGFMSLLLQQDLTRAFSETLTPTGDGASVGSDTVGGNLSSQVAELAAILHAREGEITVPNINHEKVLAFRIIGVNEENYPLTRNGRPVPLLRIVLDIEADLSNGSTETGRLHFGQACVEEGVAYLVDRMVAADGVGAAGPDNAPPFPYWVLRELALTGSPIDLTAIEIATLGTLALLTPDPAGIFLYLRDDYVSARKAGRPIQDALRHVWQQRRPDVEGVVRLIIEQELPGLRAMHRGRGLTESAADWLATQYATALTRRLENPFFDLDPFTHNRLDRARLSLLLRTWLPCDVIIGRPGGHHAIERDVIVCFGIPGLTTNGHTLSDILRTLEAQVHFVLSHLGTDTFHPTDEIEKHIATLPEEDVAPCPFYSSCGLKLRHDNGPTCFRRPWRIFDPGRQNCWYGTGVAATLGPVRLGNVIRDPREHVREHRRIVRAVERRAYDIWEERSREPDKAWAHWFQARHELGVPDDYHI